MSDKCVDCKFCTGQAGEFMLECRFNPPTTSPMGMSYSRHFSMVNPDDWCHQFKPKKGVGVIQLRAEISTIVGRGQDRNLPDDEHLDVVDELVQLFVRKMDE